VPAPCELLSRGVLESCSILGRHASVLRDSRWMIGQRAAGRHEGLGLLPLKGKRRADGEAGLVRWERERRVQAGSAISRDRSSLLMALLRRRSDTRA
jgi:hypothetical protein